VVCSLLAHKSIGSLSHLEAEFDEPRILGMNEVLFNLYDVTGNETHLETGRFFNHWKWCTYQSCLMLDDASVARCGAV